MRLADWLFTFSPTFHRLQAHNEFLRERLDASQAVVREVNAERDEARESHRAALEQMSQMVRDGFRAPYSGRKELPTPPPEPISDDEQEIRNAIARRVPLNTELGRSMLADAKKRLAKGEEGAEEIAGSILDGADLDEPGIDIDLDEEEEEEPEESLEDEPHPVAEA